jgi:hypothetical protein
MAEKIIINTNISIIDRVERIASQIRDLDIEFQPSELILRNAPELLLIREYRALQLDKMKIDASSSLKPIKNI